MTDAISLKISNYINKNIGEQKDFLIESDVLVKFYGCENLNHTRPMISRAWKSFWSLFVQKKNKAEYPDYCKWNQTVAG